MVTLTVDGFSDQSVATSVSLVNNKRSPMLKDHDGVGHAEMSTIPTTGELGVPERLTFPFETVRSAVQLECSIKRTLEFLHQPQKHAPFGKSGGTKVKRTYRVHPVHPVVTPLSLDSNRRHCRILRDHTLSFSLCSFIILCTVLNLMRKTLRTM